MLGANAVGGLADNFRLADLVGGDDLILVDKENGEAGGTNQLLYLADLRAQVSGNFRHRSCLDAMASPVDDERG